LLLAAVAIRQRAWLWGFWPSLSLGSLLVDLLLPFSVCGPQLPRPSASPLVWMAGIVRIAPHRSTPFQSAPRAPAAHEWEVVAASNSFSCLQLVGLVFWYLFFVVVLFLFFVNWRKNVVRTNGC